MRRIIKTAGAVCAMGLGLFAFSCFADRDGTPTETDAAVPVQQAAANISPIPEGQYALFPGLNMDAITAISVRTPDSSFQFYADASGGVSVNGQLADAEIYRTLVSQICELPVKSLAAFTPQTSQLLLTLVVCTGGSEHTATFYEDLGTGQMARVITGTADAPQYGQTGGWRVGKLMMTCEGTRIQDESGNETPSGL